MHTKTETLAVNRKEPRQQGKSIHGPASPQTMGRPPGYLVDVAIVTGAGTVIMTQLLRYASGSEQLST